MTPPCTRAIGGPILTGRGIAQKCGATPATPHAVSHAFRTPPGVMHHACKRGGSERNPHDRKDASKLQRARTTHDRSTRMHPQIAKRARDNRRRPMRRPELSLSPTPVHPSARRFQALNLRQPAPLAGRESRCAPPRARRAGRDVERTPARREVGSARNEPGGAAQRRGASGVALRAWGCARFARKPPTGLTNSKTGCATCHAPRTFHTPKVPNSVMSTERDRAPSGAPEALSCGTRAHSGSDTRSPPPRLRQAPLSARTSNLAL